MRWDKIDEAVLALLYLGVHERDPMSARLLRRRASTRPPA